MSYKIRVIAIIVMAVFIFTQCGIGWALRESNAGGRTADGRATGLADKISSDIKGQGITNLDSSESAVVHNQTITGASGIGIPRKDVLNLLNSMADLRSSYIGQIDGFHIVNDEIGKKGEGKYTAFVSVTIEDKQGVISAGVVSKSFVKVMDSLKAIRSSLSNNAVAPESFANTLNILVNIESVVQDLQSAPQGQSNVFAKQGNAVIFIEVLSNSDYITIHLSTEGEAVDELRERVLIPSAALGATPDFAKGLKYIEEFKDLEKKLKGKVDEIVSRVSINHDGVVVFTSGTASLGFYHLAKEFGIEVEILTAEEMNVLTNASPAAVDTALKAIAGRLGFESVRLCALEDENISTEDVETVRIDLSKIYDDIKHILSSFGINAVSVNVEDLKEVYGIAKQIAEWV